jgi:putative transposase
MTATASSPPPSTRFSAARASRWSTPIRAPQANAYAERFVRTVRAECLDWLLIIGRRHLEHVLRVYTAHYNRERPHRALALLPPDSTRADPQRSGGEIKRRDRLGGLIHEYHRAA